MIRVALYAASDKAQWDAFVRGSKNAVFFFQRDYLEYHADRFHDHSLLFFRDGELVALLPANRSQDRLVSHGGLTFGGFLVGSGMTTRLMLQLFDSLRGYLRTNGFRTLIYKCIPHIYHILPAEEDRYALFLHGARLWRRDITSTVAVQNRPAFQERRRRGVRRAQAAGVVTRQSAELDTFWSILQDNLQRVHGISPVHTGAEMTLLQEKFPDNIKLFAAYYREQMLAGVLVFENATVAHAQYISASEEGKRQGALDVLFSWLITEVYAEKDYFDFGISTENNGKLLNEGLIDQKEGFGARGVVHDQYEVAIAAAEPAVA